MTTLSLEASKKLYELIGEYETELHWAVAKPNEMSCFEPLDISGWENEYLEKWQAFIPAPNFAELIRVLPKVGEKKGWSPYDEPLDIKHLVSRYIFAPTEPEGMHQVEEYLMKLL